MNVVTYTEAYRDVQWALCRRHQADDAAEVRRESGMGPLGHVLKGAGPGRCDVCEAAKMK